MPLDQRRDYYCTLQIESWKSLEISNNRRHSNQLKTKLYKPPHRLTWKCGDTTSQLVAMHVKMAGGMWGGATGGGVAGGGRGGGGCCEMSSSIGIKRIKAQDFPAAACCYLHSTHKHPHP
jgi:hypothetical protein